LGIIRLSDCKNLANVTIQTFFHSLLVERKDEQDFTHYFNIPLGKKEIGNGENWSHKEK